MLKGLYTLAFLLTVTAYSFAQSNDSLFLEAAKNKKKYRIAAIKIEGAENTDRSVITLLSGLSEGDEITIPGDKISDAIKKLWKQSMFENIQIFQEKVIGNDVFLTIRVTERPRLSHFKFIGVRRGDADDIRTKIRLLKERVITDYLIGSIKNTVKDHYLEKGYYFTKVDILQVKDTANKAPHTILTIKVTKGPKVRIQDVNIKGNTVIKSWKLRRKLEDSKRWRHNWCPSQS